MKKNILSLLSLVFLITSLNAQKLFTREGNVSFSSDAPMEKIEANNTKGTSVIDTENSKIEFAVLIKAFQFEKSLMQEHFNENYMESDKYPKAVFKGKFDQPDQVDFNKDGNYSASVSGDLSIHGQTKQVNTQVELTIKNGIVSTRTSFVVLVADYGIEIPSVVRDNIAKEVKIDIRADYQVFKKGT